MEKLDQAVHWLIDAIDCRDPGFAEKLIHEGYKNVVLEDKERWDGASIGKIQDDFRVQVERVDSTSISDDFPFTCAAPRYMACLVIDEECLQSIKDSPEMKERSRWTDMGYVFVVDPTWTSEEVNGSGYRGVLVARICGLW
jgi:hypothetical protein